MEKYAAIILAAGKGTRMNEGESAPIPKVMFPLANRKIIDWSVASVKNIGINKIVLVVGYKKELIEDHFGDSLEYAVQAEQLGTGHAAMMAKELLEGKSENVIIFYGDCPLYKPQTIKKLLDLYENSEGDKPTVAMLTVVSPESDITGYGRVFRDKKGDVIGIIEHKDCTPKELECREWNPGFYIFNANWFWQNITKLSSDNAQHEYYLTDMIVMAKEQNKRIVAMPVSEESEGLGINTLLQLKEAEAVLNSR